MASSKKLNLLSRGQQAATPASQQQQQGQQQQLGFCWSSIIWTQALQHNNLQVGLLQLHVAAAVLAVALRFTWLDCLSSAVRCLHLARLAAPAAWLGACVLLVLCVAGSTHGDEDTAQA